MVSTTPSLHAELPVRIHDIGKIIGLATLIAALPFRSPAQEIRVTLLGTGSPAPAMNRFGPSILVEAGGETLLFDVGRGALQRLGQAKVPWQQVDGVFFTHLHSDHVVGFPDAWLSGWLVGAGRNRPLDVWGPRGIRAMVHRLEQAYAFDIAFRKSDDRAPAAGVVVRAADVEPGVVLRRNGVVVTAFDVDHAPVTPAFGYRIDYGGRSVVLSGDTRFSENLVRHAAGVDLLVHEVASPESFRRNGVAAERTASVLAHHTTPERAGEVFARARPRLAVYSHIVQPDATDAELIESTRRTYAGEVVVGEDLMVIEVGDAIRVQRPGGR
jgi:ribonuclease Z